MTITEFENGYWYAIELKEFAMRIGVPSASKLRKDELERSIRTFLETGSVVDATKRRLSRTGVKDLEIGLSLDLPVVNYTSNRQTKSFIEGEARKLSPELKKRSGARYRLNRWREEQLTSGRRITYRDLVNEYIRLNASTEPFERFEHGRYVNFVADFLKNENDATHEAAVAAWKVLKKMDAPKNYAAWVGRRSKR